jgi:hypothetical protein
MVAEASATMPRQDLALFDGEGQSDVGAVLQPPSEGIWGRSRSREGPRVRRLAAGGGSHERTRLCLEIFPAGSEFAGNFARFGISVAFQGPKTYVSPTTYGPNSLDVRAGNFYDVAGN